MKFNRTILSIGTLAAVVAPVATVVACGNTNPKVTPPTKGNVGGKTPDQKGPTTVDPKSTGTPTTVVTPGIPKTGTPSTVTQTDTDALDDGIFDYSTDHHFSHSELNKIFEDKFTVNMDFGAAKVDPSKLSGTDIFKTIGALNKESIDSSRLRKKVLILSTPNGNNGIFVLLAGVIGYKINAAGNPTNEVIFRFNDFNDAAKISDNSKDTSEKNIILSRGTSPADINTVFSLSIPGTHGATVFSDIVDFAKPFFTDAKFE